MAAGGLVAGEHEGALEHEAATVAIELEGGLLALPAVEEPGEELGAEGDLGGHADCLVGGEVEKFHAVGVEAAEAEGGALGAAEHGHAPGGLAEEGAEHLHGGLVHGGGEEALAAEVDGALHAAEAGLGVAQEGLEHTLLHVGLRGAGENLHAAGLTLHLEFGHEGGAQETRGYFLLRGDVGEPQPVTAPAVLLGEVGVQRVRGPHPAVKGLIAGEGVEGRERTLGEELHLRGLEGLGEIERVERERTGFNGHG